MNGRLSLTRKLGEQIRIGEDVIVTVTTLGLDRVTLTIEAPKVVPVYREEVRRARQLQQTLTDETT